MRTFVVLAAGVMFGAQAASLAAYLPVLGPGPLRFITRFQPVVVSVAPAAAAQGPTTPHEPASTAAAIPTNAVAETAPSPVVPAALAATVETVVHTAKSPETAAEVLAANSLTNRSYSLIGGAAETNLITPQMMLYFFEDHRRGTNAPMINAAMPIEFVPPIPFLRAPSKATYQTP